MSATQNTYRASVILDLRGYTEPVETVIEKLKDTIKAVEGSVTEVKNLGSKDFVRITDRKNPNGTYVQILFSAPAAGPAAFRQKLRLDKTIKRILIQSV